MELLARLVRNPEGRPVRMIGTNRDITEQKRTEEALRKSTKGAGRSWKVSTMLLFAGQERMFTYVNQHACNLWKKEIRRMIGQKSGTCSRWATETERTRRCTVLWREVAKSSSRPIRRTSKPGRLCGCTPPMKGSRCIFKTSREWKKAEAALRRSEQLYRAIGETINWGIWICDPEGRNIYASPSFLTMVGMTQQECSEFGWGNVLHPDDADTTIAAWKECSRAGTFWERTHRFKGVDGKYHHVLARGILYGTTKANIIVLGGNQPRRR